MYLLCIPLLFQYPCRREGRGPSAGLPLREMDQCKSLSHHYPSFQLVLVASLHY